METCSATRFPSDESSAFPLTSITHGFLYWLANLDSCRQLLSGRIQKLELAEYWVMGAITAVMLFVSVLIHELGHSVVAKHYGIPVPRITLFVFGGVSQIAEEPASAGQEFWIAVVGPAVSFALAALFWELEPLVSSSTPLLALAEYLALINLVLGIFNLIPGFPLDGGRVLRAIVWRVTGKYQRATAVAAVTGRFFGFFLIFLGVWQALFGNFINGLWMPSSAGSWRAPREANSSRKR